MFNVHICHCECPITESYSDVSDVFMNSPSCIFMTDSVQVPSLLLFQLPLIISVFERINLPLISCNTKNVDFVFVHDHSMYSYVQHSSISSSVHYEYLSTLAPAYLHEERKRKSIYFTPQRHWRKYRRWWKCSKKADSKSRRVYHMSELKRAKLKRICKSFEEAL